MKNVTKVQKMTTTQPSAIPIAKSWLNSTRLRLRKTTAGSTV